MNFKRYRSIGNVFLLFLIALSVSCTSDKKQQKTQPAVKSVELPKVPGSYLFDGNSLEGWEVTQFGTEGPVDVSDGKIILNYGDGCTGVTYKNDFPKVNYEVQLEARRTSGNDFFCGMTFPVNDEFCSLVVGGWGGPVVGLSCIDGNDASDNSTKILKRFDKNVWYKIKLQVTDSKIIAWIDGEKLVDFSYPGHELYVRPEVELSKPFGICSWITTSELRNISLRELLGSGR